MADIIHEGENAHCARSRHLDIIFLILLVMACFAISSCRKGVREHTVVDAAAECGLSADEFAKWELSNDEFARLKQRLGSFRKQLNKMSGEDLFVAFDFDEESPLPETVEEVYFIAFRDVLIEQELVNRGAKVKEDLIRHQHDTRTLITGLSTPYGVVRDLCAHHLKRLNEIEEGTYNEEGFKLYLWFAADDTILSALIGGASVGGQRDSVSNNPTKSGIEDEQKGE